MLRHDPCTKKKLERQLYSLSATKILCHPAIRTAISKQQGGPAVLTIYQPERWVSPVRRSKLLSCICVVFELRTSLLINASKRKISKDPNNTKWARKTDSFGQKFMRAQGWEPGQYLGVQDASHAEFHTAANASHIRVLLKDDNLGIGAKRNQGDECTGLDVFKDLLGRLNGKSETVIQEERKARENVKMSLYVERKYGPMRFVSGGLLVGDKIQELLKQQREATSDGMTSGDADTSTADAERTPRKEKKSKKRKAEVESDDATQIDDEGEKRKKKNKKSKTESDESSSKVEVTSGTRVDADGDASVKSRKKEKKEKKTKKKLVKEEVGDEPDSQTEKAETRKKKKELRSSDEDTSTPTSEAEPSAALGRHLARRKFIAQKRRAVLDPQALNQVCEPATQRSSNACANNRTRYS